VIDAHAHLQAPAFADKADEVLASAAAAGVDRILVPGWDAGSSQAAVDLARQARGNGAPLVVAAAGIHPHDSKEADESDWHAIEALAADPAVVAIGETGLDYDRMFSPRETQLENLRRHLALALRTGKPLVLHCRSAPGVRDAQDALLRELDAAGVGGEAWHAAFGERPPAVLHSYSGPVDYGERALDLGLAVSFSGLVFRDGQRDSELVAQRTPSDRLLVETDAPFLTPLGAPRRRNEPAFVSLTAAWLAERRGIDVTSLERDLALSFERLFGKERPISGDA
jgi:TatD DNase family protein